MISESLLITILTDVGDGLLAGFFLASFILFYRSVKKCFWKEGMSKGKLLLLSSTFYSPGLC